VPTQNVKIGGQFNYLAMDLHQQFVQLGKEHRVIIYKMQAILPEINKQGIYKRYASDIYEYARKYAGLSSGVVCKILKTYERIEDKPALKLAIAKVGVHKVALVAGLANSQNEQRRCGAVC